MTTPSVISVSTGVNVGMVSTLTFSHTVAAGIDRFLTVAITFWNSGGEVVSTVDFNSVAMTFVGADSRPDVRTELWRLVNPDVGTFDVDIVLDGPLDHASAPLFGAAIDYVDVHQTVPLGTVATADGEDPTPTVNVSSGSDELVVDTMGANIGGGTTVSVGSGQTERYNPGVQGSGGRRTLPAGSTEPGPGTVTMDWALDDAGPQSEPWAIVAASILPASVIVTPPTVDAGGPYNGPSGQATALDATVTPGTDPTPVLLWTIDSGGAGVFSDDSIEDPTFTPTFPTVGPYVLRLTVTPSDGPAVFDTANFESEVVAPTVDAGGPYAGGVSTPIALNATVTPGTDPAPTLLWTIDSGGTGTFSDDTAEDPTFTADGIGAYVLRLTVTSNDGPDVFDTAALTTAALADAVFLGGSLLRGGTGDLVMSQLSLGTDPPGGDTVFIKGTAHSNSGAMYVAIDDGVVPRVFIAGIAHQQNGVRLVTLNPPLVSLNAWGLDANGAQGVSVSGAGQPHEGVLLRGDGQMVVDGVSPVVPPPLPPDMPGVIQWWDSSVVGPLFQDIAGTIPVVSGGQILRRIVNKGSQVTPLLTGVADTDVIWDANFQNGLGGAKVSANPASIENLSAVSVTNGYTMLVVASVVDPSVTNWVANWQQGFDGPVVILGDVWASFSGGGKRFNNSNPTPNQVWACVMQWDNAGNFYARLNIDSVVLTGNQSPFATMFAGQVMGFVSVGTSGMTVGDFIIWNNATVSVASIESFATSKWNLPFL